MRLDENAPCARSSAQSHEFWSRSGVCLWELLLKTSPILTVTKDDFAPF